jgi:NAD/NADP transhydrogenase beta subunit
MVVLGGILGGIVGFAISVVITEVLWVNDYEWTAIINVVLTVIGVSLGATLARRLRSRR